MMKRSMLLISVLLWLAALGGVDAFPLARAWNMDWESNAVGFDDGSTVLVWEDTSQGNWAIRAQKIALDGLPIWSAPTTVVCKARFSTPSKPGPARMEGCF